MRHIDQLLAREIIDRVLDMGDSLPTERKAWYLWDYRDGELRLINLHQEGPKFLMEQRGEDFETTNAYLQRRHRDLKARALEAMNAVDLRKAKTPQWTAAEQQRTPQAYIIK